MFNIKTILKTVEFSYCFVKNTNNTVIPDEGEFWSG